MRILHNGRLLTRDTDRPWFERGAVAFAGPGIIEVGPEQEIRRRYPDAALTDAGGGLIMPAFINMHQHAYSAFARGLNLPGYAPKSFAGILNDLWWRLDAALNEEDIYLSALLTFTDCVKNGVTTVFDHHAGFNAIEGSLSVIAEAAGLAGLRACLCFEVSDRAGQGAAARAVAENARFLDKCRKEQNPALAGMMGLHASFTVSDATLAAARAAAPAGTGFHLHLAEGPEDQHHCLKEHGLRVAERLQREGILGPHSIAAHGIDVDEKEIAILAKSQTALIHNPQSNMGNAVGVAPLTAMEAAGVKLGLGTDGYTHDMLESMKAAQLLQKHHLHDTNSGFSLATDMLFRQNPRLAARHFSTLLGQIKPGAAADMIVLDYEPFTPLDETNADGHAVFGLGGRQVRTVLSAGQLLLYKGELCNIDEEKICAEAQKAAQKLWARM
ncbi:MAG: putative aminohydrolase SsnA [Clostridiales bacterium]|nr:putative aminohydrolase SsnA [Clostridiales bacterium]